MQEFIDKIVSTANKLNGIGFEISDEWTGAVILVGLTEQYRPMIMSIEASDNDISADAIISKLLDSQPGNGNGEAFYSKKKSSKSKKKSIKKVKKCFICDTTNHLANACPDKVKKEKSDEKKSASTAFMVGLLSMNSKHDWFIDSGASNHMTSNKDIFFNKKQADIAKITVASGEQMNVEFAGDSKLDTGNESIEVRNILYVPQLSANLLSVHKMVCKGNTIVFNEEGCRVYNKNKQLVSSCKPENGVYRIRMQPSTEKCMISKRDESNAMQWHRRFGHLNYSTLMKLNTSVLGLKINADNSEIKNCAVCPMGKQHRQPFNVSTTRAKGILDLIHTDLAGPMETKSICGARYMLTFTDDFSRKTFLYFLGEKSKTLSAFIEFKNLIENETDRKIKTLRSDNGTEYMSNEFAIFLKKHGIAHQRTRTYTPEQNGVAERANRTIEKGRCMIFDAKLPIKFWAEACNMAAYLMNRTPRILLENKTPEEMWSGTAPDVSHLKNFGSKVMVHTPKEKRKKWTSKATEMLFVKFDNLKKGFRCFNSVNSKVIVSRDVTFFESDSSTVKVNFNDDEEEERTEERIEVSKSTNKPVETGVRETIDDDADDVSESESDLNETVRHFSHDETDNDQNDDDFTTRASIPTIPRASSRNRTQVRPFQYIHFALLSLEPQTAREAVSNDDGMKWKEAMLSEIESHHQNETWTLVQLPEERKAIK